MPINDKIIRPVNPYTLETEGQYPMMGFSALIGTIATAKRASQLWRKVEVAERVQLLQQGLQYFEVHRKVIAQDITRQMGKPIGQSENEVKGFFERADFLHKYAESILAPEILPVKAGFHRRIEHVPLGVVLIIAPWNYPLLTAVNGVATALLAGNSVILKHSTLTPAVGEHFAKAFGQLGPYQDLLQAVLVEHADLGRAISEGDIDHVVFTGSVEGGRSVQKAAAHRFIDCNLELGGKDGAYVAADADLDKAAADLVDGAMYNAGQSCCGIERVYVHRKLYDEFVSRCEILTRDYHLGDPLDRQTNMGPLASAQAAIAMSRQVAMAQDQGAKIIVGGKSRMIGRGTFFEPTLITGVNNSMEIVREENFGPILPIMPVTDDEQALSLINDSPYGLTSAIYTRDLDLANRFATGADTGTVFMNRCDYLEPALPWTGVRNSGRGSTLSKYGFYSLTRRKAVHFRLPE
jgi:acyl-CoA reductase-like NAD-dependent aldehyde dehydrogenase